LRSLIGGLLGLAIRAGETGVNPLLDELRALRSLSFDLDSLNLLVMDFLLLFVVCLKVLKSNHDDCQVVEGPFNGRAFQNRIRHLACDLVNCQVPSVVSGLLNPLVDLQSLGHGCPG